MLAASGGLKSLDRIDALLTANKLEIRVANLWANRLNADSLLPESERFTRSNLDRIQTDPTSDSSYGRVPRGKERPVYTDIPPLMKSGLFKKVRFPLRLKKEFPFNKKAFCELLVGQAGPAAAGKIESTAAKDESSSGSRIIS